MKFSQSSYTLENNSPLPISDSSAPPGLTRLSPPGLDQFVTNANLPSTQKPTTFFQTSPTFHSNNDTASSYTQLQSSYPSSSPPPSNFTNAKNNILKGFDISASTNQNKPDNDSSQHNSAHVFSRSGSQTTSTHHGHTHNRRHQRRSKHQQFNQQKLHDTATNQPDGKLDIQASADSSHSNSTPSTQVSHKHTLKIAPSPFHQSYSDNPKNKVNQRRLIINTNEQSIENPPIETSHNNPYLHKKDMKPLKLIPSEANNVEPTDSIVSEATDKRENIRHPQNAHKDRSKNKKSGRNNPPFNAPQSTEEATSDIPPSFKANEIPISNVKQHPSPRDDTPTHHLNSTNPSEPNTPRNKHHKQNKSYSFQQSTTNHSKGHINNSNNQPTEAPHKGANRSSHNQNSHTKKKYEKGNNLPETPKKNSIPLFPIQFSGEARNWYKSFLIHPFDDKICEICCEPLDYHCQCHLCNTPFCWMCCVRLWHLVGTKLCPFCNTTMDTPYLFRNNPSLYKPSVSSLSSIPPSGPPERNSLHPISTSHSFKNSSPTSRSSHEASSALNSFTTCTNQGETPTTKPITGAITDSTDPLSNIDEVTRNPDVRNDVLFDLDRLIYMEDSLIMLIVRLVFEPRCWMAACRNSWINELNLDSISHLLDIPRIVSLGKHKKGELESGSADFSRKSETGLSHNHTAIAVYERPSELFEHLRKFHGRHVCLVCFRGKKISFLSELKYYKKHELEIHRKEGDGNEDTQGEGHPVCPICEISLLDGDAYFNHVKFTHFYCELCLKQTEEQATSDRAHNSTRTSLYNHLIVFGSFSDLSKHYSTHHFICPHCTIPQIFQSREELNYHFLTSHDQSSIFDSSNKLSRFKLYNSSRADVNHRSNQTHAHQTSSSSSSLNVNTPTSPINTNTAISDSEHPSTSTQEQQLPKEEQLIDSLLASFEDFQDQTTRTLISKAQQNEIHNIISSQSWMDVNNMQNMHKDIGQYIGNKVVQEFQAFVPQFYRMQQYSKERFIWKGRLEDFLSKQTEADRSYLYLYVKSIKQLKPTLKIHGDFPALASTHPPQTSSVSSSTISLPLISRQPGRTQTPMRSSFMQKLTPSARNINSFALNSNEQFPSLTASAGYSPSPHSDKHKPQFPSHSTVSHTQITKSSQKHNKINTNSIHSFPPLSASSSQPIDPSQKNLTNSKQSAGSRNQKQSNAVSNSDKTNAWPQLGDSSISTSSTSSNKPTPSLWASSETHNSPWQPKKKEELPQQSSNTHELSTLQYDPPLSISHHNNNDHPISYAANNPNYKVHSKVKPLNDKYVYDSNSTPEQNIWPKPKKTPPPTISYADITSQTSLPTIQQQETIQCPSCKYTNLKEQRNCVSCDALLNTNAIHIKFKSNSKNKFF